MQQMVEIIKVYSRRPKLIAFDEPTTALTEAEAEKLFYIIEEKLKKQDIIILYVSHRMNEVFRLSDRIVVFKDGELVHTAVTAETDEEAIVQRMVGRPLEKVFGELKRNAPAEDCILRVTGYSGRGLSGRLLYPAPGRGHRFLRIGGRGTDGADARHFRRG